MQRLLRRVSGEVVLVMAAGGDPHEAADIAELYRELGARRLLMTRIDGAHRYGAMLNAAAHARLAVTEVGISPNVADGLKQVNPVSLARLLLPQMEEPSPPPPQRARRGAYA
jgi:flagellar biosynthesis protein FlhF